MTSLIAYWLFVVLALAEIWTCSAQVRATSTAEHVASDTVNQKRIRVNLNITFPGLACEDLHVDIQDITGDIRLDLEDTMKKRRLNRLGLLIGQEEEVKINKRRDDEEKRMRIQATELPADYCGPCYGADPPEGKQCCDTCDEITEAYKKRRIPETLIHQTAEQCIREGKDKLEPKRLRHGEGCNLAGYFSINPVDGNFHIAMGEGIERDGRHFHTFDEDDAYNFNASHIIHSFSFGAEPDFEDIDGDGDPRKRQLVEQHSDGNDRASLNGVSKIVDGTTGLFRYFIKIDPTPYVSDDKLTAVDTYRYSFTEQFHPLMKEYLDDDQYYGDTAIQDDDAGDGSLDDVDEGSLDDVDDDSLEEENLDAERRMASGKAGSGRSSKPEHHNVKISGLPGVYFIYEIYPFSVEVPEDSVQTTHL